MSIKDYMGNTLPANHNLHIMYPWGTDSRTVTLQPGIALDKQPIVQQLDDWIKRRPGNSLIGYAITRGNDVRIYIDGGYEYYLVGRNPSLIDQIQSYG